MTPDTDDGLDGVEFARGMLTADRASSGLGMRLLRCAPGTATVAMVVTEDMLNGHAITHGGVVFALADTAFAVACNGYGRATVSTGSLINFLAPSAAGDELVAEATERTRGKRTGVYDVTVRRGGEVVAEFRGTSRELARQPANGLFATNMGDRESGRPATSGEMS